MGVGNDGEGGTRSRDNARRHTNVGTHGGAVRCGVCAWAWRVGPGDEGALVELEGRTARPKPHPQRTALVGTVSHEGPRYDMSEGVKVHSQRTCELLDVAIMCVRVSSLCVPPYSLYLLDWFL